MERHHDAFLSVACVAGGILRASVVVCNARPLTNPASYPGYLISLLGLSHVPPGGLRGEERVTVVIIII